MSLSLGNLPMPTLPNINFTRKGVMLAMIIICLLIVVGGVIGLFAIA